MAETLRTVTADLLSSHENERKCEWVFARAWVIRAVRELCLYFYLSVLLSRFLSFAPSFSLSQSLLYPLLLSFPLFFPHPFGLPYLRSFLVPSGIPAFACFKLSLFSPPFIAFDPLVQSQPLSSLYFSSHPLISVTHLHYSTSSHYLPLFPQFFYLIFRVLSLWFRTPFLSENLEQDVFRSFASLPPYHSKVHLRSRTWGICAFRPSSLSLTHTHTHTHISWQIDWWQGCVLMMLGSLEWWWLTLCDRMGERERGRV